MLQELLKRPAGMEEVLGDIDYQPRDIAAEIRNRNAHAVLWHPTKELYYFASEFHKEAAQTLLKSVVQKCSREQWWSLCFVAMPPPKKKIMY